MATTIAPGVLGTEQTRLEGREKVTGRAVYAYEHPVEGVVYAWLVQATIARGTVRAVDGSEARRRDGVLEAVDVDRGRRYGEPVAPVDGLQELAAGLLGRAERPPEVRHVDAEGVDRASGGVVGPEVCDERADRNRLRGRQGQPRQQRALLAPAEGLRNAGPTQCHRTEQVDVDRHKRRLKQDDGGAYRSTAQHCSRGGHLRDGSGTGRARRRVAAGGGRA